MIYAAQGLDEVYDMIVRCEMERPITTLFMLMSVDVVVAPILIGGKDTSTLIDGQSLMSESELSQLMALKLEECVVLENSYLRLRYKVMN